jgi:RNA polymerase sigma-70 factor (sigma-E family)
MDQDRGYLALPPRPTRVPTPVRRHDDDFIALYREQRPRLVRLATLLVDRADIAEELVQEAFAATYRDWDRLDNPTAFTRIVVVNRARSELRRRQTRRRRPVRAALAGLGEPDHLRDVISRLPERQRTVVVLRFYEDLPLGEIALTMGIRTGTVKSHLHRALAALRKEIKP